MPQTSIAPQSPPQTSIHVDPAVAQEIQESWLPAPHISLHDDELTDSHKTPANTAQVADLHENLSVNKAMGSMLMSFLFSIATGLIGVQLGLFPSLVAVFFVIGSLFGHVVGAIETARGYAIVKSANEMATGTDR